MTTSFRIAVGSIFIECNQFGGVPADLSRFEQYELRWQRQVLEITDGVVGGMLSVLSDRRIDIQPLIVASTCPSGPVTRECYDQLKLELLSALDRSMPLDGVLLALHGAGAVLENSEPMVTLDQGAEAAIRDGISPIDAFDLEADLLEVVRAAVGNGVAIVATLDMHAHISEPMIRNADALVTWETYPHCDVFETGGRGARMLLGILDGEFRPTMAIAKAPVLVGGVLGQTEGEGAFAKLVRMTKELLQLPGVLSTNLTMTHPYLDFPSMGGGALVVTDNDVDRAVTLSCQIAERFWDYRTELEPEVFTPAEAIREGLTIDGGPVLLVETADCAGGGGAGDSVASIRALIEADLEQSSLGIVVDPKAAAWCHQAGVGAEGTLEVGHQLDPKWGSPARFTGQVVGLSDGTFLYTGGIWKGTMAEMGLSAVFQVGQVQILIASRATYDWADEQYRSLAMDTRCVKFIVVKNPMNFRIGYAGVMRQALILDTPGPTPATIRHFRYRRMRRPYFPVDAQISMWEPHTLRSKLTEQ